MEEYEVFHPECNMLRVGEMEEEEDKGTTSQTFPTKYGEYKGVAELDDTLAHKFEHDKLIKYEEPKMKKVNLGEEDKPKTILVGDDWDPILKATAFKIFLEHKDAFTWTCKDLKRIPPKLCVHKIPLVPGAQLV